MKTQKALISVIAMLACAQSALAKEPPPACDDPQTEELVVNTINRAIRNNPAVALQANGARAIEFDGVSQIYADAAIRACEARVKRSDGVFRNGFTVEWVNRSKDQFAIQLVGIDTLRSRYSKDRD